MKLSHLFTNDIRPGRLFNIPPQPINVMLDVTTYCNNHCLFCYNSSSSAGVKETSDSTVLKKIVDLLGKTGTREILYLGGEPFSLPELPEILEIGQNYGIFQRTVSNGSFLKDKSFCENLRQRGLSEVGISFHSSHDNIHDKLSGRKGSFKDAMAAVENSLAAGITVFIQYSPTQLNSTDDIIRLAKDVHTRFGKSISLFDINRLLPLGNGSDRGNLFLEGDNWFHFLCAASSLFQKGFDVRAELTPFCWLQYRAEISGISQDDLALLFEMNRGCYMWVAQLPLDHAGRIKFCPAGLSVGPSILDVRWPLFWREWKEFDKYRGFLWNNTCVDFDEQKICSFFYHCLGGCKYSEGDFGPDKYTSGICKTMNGVKRYEEKRGKETGNNSQRFPGGRQILHSS